MEKKPKPVLKHGERNLFCPFYDDCLDQAVRGNWHGWDCCDCPQRFLEDAPRESRFTASLPVDFYELPSGMEG